MAEEVVSKEEMDFTIDMLITMVVEELAKDLGKDTKDVLADFCVSKTGRALYDESTKLWWNGPSYIADMYKEELIADKFRENKVVRCTS